jgi:hypothetical protein
MDITLMGLLWLYMFDLYVRAPFDGLNYTGHIYNSDAAIPIIGLGILLNTGAIIMLLRESRKARLVHSETKTALPLAPFAEMARENEIDDLEKELGRLIGRLEELKQPSNPPETH